MSGEGKKGGDLVPLGPKESISAKPGEIHESVLSASTGVVTTAQEVLDFETDGYFTSMLEGADFRDESVKSLHKRLSEMDDLLGDSVDFGNKAIFEKISQTPNEADRVKYIESLILRLALVLQELQRSMNNFLRGGNNREFRIIATWDDGKESQIFTRLIPVGKGGLRFVIGDKPIDDKEGFGPLYSRVRPIDFNDDTFGIKKDSTQVLSLGDTIYPEGRTLKFPDGKWKENKFLRIAHGLGHRNEAYSYELLKSNHRVLAVINDGEITLDVYNDILKRIQALAFQVGDLGELLNKAGEEARKNLPREMPKITF